MKIVEATEFDRSVCDNFVNTQGGMFYQYFSWKYVCETSGDSFFPLMIENNQSQLVGLFCLIKKEHKLFSELSSHGLTSILFREGLSSDEKYKITLALIKYIDIRYSSKCSSFVINEQLPLDFKEAENQALIECGFRIRNDRKSGLPCSNIIPLTSSFAEDIWKRLWSRQLKQQLIKVEKSGIRVVQDRELKYIEEYMRMVIATYKRHRTREPPNRDYILTAFKVFKNNIKLFVALNHDQPIAILSCIYTPSTCYLWQIGTYSRDVDNVNKYCFKTAIEDACNQGYQFVDFLASYTSGLSTFKKRFGAKQTPIMVYEKRYSIPSVLCQYASSRVNLILFNLRYVYGIRSSIWKKIC